MKNNLKQISKYLSLVLRHKPEELGITLDENGWADVQELISKMNLKGMEVDFGTLTQVVITNDKQRFAFNDDKTLLRASQGHSIEVNLDLLPIEPPEILFHGTTGRFLENILRSGILKQNRRHVHLSFTEETATAVGSRHGKPVILKVRAKLMSDAGHHFYLSENRVWLTDYVPPEFIER